MNRHRFLALLAVALLPVGARAQNNGGGPIVLPPPLMKGTYKETSGFGPRVFPLVRTWRLGVPRILEQHMGVDLACRVGTPVFAPEDALVDAAGVSRSFGLTLILKHRENLYTVYGHLLRLADGITAGAIVRRGQIVAFTGNSGEDTTGPHLHWSVVVDGAVVNPRLYCPYL